MKLNVRFFHKERRKKEEGKRRRVRPTATYIFANKGRKITWKS